MIYPVFPGLIMEWQSDVLKTKNIKDKKCVWTAVEGDELRTLSQYIAKFDSYFPYHLLRFTSNVLWAFLDSFGGDMGKVTVP